LTIHGGERHGSNPLLGAGQRSHIIVLIDPRGIVAARRAADDVDDEAMVALAPVAEDVFDEAERTSGTGRVQPVGPRARRSTCRRCAPSSRGRNR
jgi:hypothetical protein